MACKQLCLIKEAGTQRYNAKCSAADYTQCPKKRGMFMITPKCWRFK